jgi:hypothetical protein
LRVLNLSESDDGIFVWQPQIALRANDATLPPHILQVISSPLAFVMICLSCPLRRGCLTDLLIFFFSMCAATRTANGYSCAICKAAYRTQGIYIKACPTCFLPCRLDFFI